MAPARTLRPLLRCCLPVLLVAAALASEAPVADDGLSTVIATAPCNVTLHGSDADTAAGMLLYTIVDGPAHGTVVHKYPDGDYDWDTSPYYSAYLTYHADTDFVGTDTLTFHISDGEHTSNTATVTITVEANHPPVAVSGWTRALADRTSQLPLLAAEQDYSQSESITIVSGPSHGTLGEANTYLMRVPYTPDAGFTGDDSFTFTYSDGIDTTAEATCHIRVVAAGDRDDMLVKIIVKPWLYAELKTEIDRLAEDLDAEGYTPEIVAWDGTDAYTLWQHLQADWQDTSKRLHGAILLGDVPVAEESDLTYWDMADYHADTRNFHIWVSRLYAQTDNEYGHEVTHIRRALDANHAYRTGRSRLPQTAAMVNMYDYYGDLPIYGRVWDHADPVQDRKVYDSMRYGEEITHRSEHNSPVSSDWLFANCDQLRFGFISGCKAGKLGAAVSQYQQTYGGGNLMSIGSKNDTYWGNFRIGQYLDDNEDDGVWRLNAGEPLSCVMLELATTSWLPLGTFAYGDLSLAVKATPHNDVPTIDDLDVSTDNPMVGDTVSFTATASDVDHDADDSPHVAWEYQAEWWFRGTGKHQIAPAVSETSTDGSATFTQTHTYAIPHSYTARLEVSDEWQGRAWKEIVIDVAPDSTRPLRINCGAAGTYAQYCPLGDWTATDGALWLHEQGHRSGTWGYSGDDGGRPANNRNPANDPVAGTENDTLYQYWRNVRKTDKDQLWRVPVSDGAYTVRLHFADMRSDAAGVRLLDAWIEDAQVLSAYDAYQEAGATTAISEEFPITVSDGEITIALRRSAEATADAFINAIEILPPYVAKRSISMDRLPEHAWTIAPAEGDESEQTELHLFDNLNPATTYSLTPQPANNG